MLTHAWFVLCPNGETGTDDGTKGGVQNKLHFKNKLIVLKKQIKNKFFII